MPPGLPHQPLAMRLWLSRRSGRAKGTDSAGHSSGRSMSIGSLEHMMRNRFRMFLRHTWLVTIFGTIVLGGVVLGIVGALIALPVAAAIQLILEEVTFRRLDES